MTPQEVKPQASHPPKIREGVEYRAAMTSMVTGLATVLSIIFQLISIPICLKYWGKDAYGNWLAVYSAFMLIKSMDTGFSAYVGNKINYLYHQDQNALRLHMASSLTGIAIIGLLQISITIGALFSERIFTIAGTSANSISPPSFGAALFILMSTWILSGSYLGIIHRLMIPSGLMYQSAWWSMGFQISQFGGIILAAMLNLDEIKTSILFSFIQSSIYLASAIYIRSKLPNYFPWWRHGRVKTGISDLAMSTYLTLSNLIQQGYTNGTIILISMLSGPAAIPIFSTIRTLSNLWANVTNVLTSPLLPEIVRYHAAGELGKLRLINQAYWVFVGSFVNIGILLTYPLIEVMYGYWTAQTVTLNKPLLSLLLSSIALANIGALINLHLNGINRLGVVLATAIVRGASILGLGIFLFKYFDLLGFGIGTAIGEFLALIITIIYFSSKELDHYHASFFLADLAPAACSVALTIVFLLHEGFVEQHFPYVYPLCLTGVIASAFWGWCTLEQSIRTRMARMVTRRLFNRV